MDSLTWMYTIMQTELLKPTNSISGLGIDTVWPNTTTTYQLDSVGDLNQCFNTLTSNTTLTVNEIPQMDWSVPSEICDNDIVYLSFDFLTEPPLGM